ncbi:MAG: hybrid sensor histidine kinase/response regulator [Deltaproteobacteria bacterium]|nr:hybrid sensor histidine kinase/response regulator [Deltaproteobacteria bacterium]
MNLKERLLFLFIPFTVLPLAFVVILAFFIFGKVGDPLLVKPYLGWALLFVTLVVIAVIVIAVGIAKSIADPLKNLTENALRIANGDLQTAIDLETDTEEVNQLFNAIEKMKSELKRQKEIIRQEAADTAIGKIASHVAHDLASPLSSLQVAAEYFQNVQGPDSNMAQHTNLLELAAKRLRAISKELLDFRKGKEPKKTIFSIHAVLDELIGEYVSQDAYGCVQFIKRYHSEALFIFGNKAKVQRAFGNLVKNAVEAMDKCGELTLTTQLEEDNVLVKVQDNGYGMEPAILEKVLSEGLTHGKENGNGIGVAVVRRTIAEHGGTISAVSEVSIGTTFFITLPIARSQQIKMADTDEDVVATFALTLKQKEPVLVLDDDVGMLEQWRIKMEQNHVTILACTSYENFEEQKITPSLTKTAIIDYHFENSELNGIEIIKKLKEQGFDNLYLCTAEYWKPSLKKEAMDLGISICPKPLPKITVCHPEALAEGSRLHREGDSSPTAQNDNSDKDGHTVLVIDDDSVIRLSWEMMRKKLHIETLHAFASLESLQMANIDLNKVDIAFVDKNIENSAFDGSQVIDFLKAKGVSKVVLASGENEDQLREDPQFAQADFVIGLKVPSTFKEFFS